MKVLFVSTGNTCRSPIAAEMFNKICKGLEMRADSAGISVVPGSTITEKSIQLLKENLNIDIDNREATQVRENTLEKANIILTMTDYSKNFIKENYPKYKEKIYSICEYAGVNGEVVDPFGSSMGVYKKTYTNLEKLVLLVIEKIKKDGSM